MKVIIDKLRHSFSARLSLWVVLTAALIYLIAQSYVSYVARRSVFAEATMRASQVLENTELRLNRILDDVQKTADNVEWLAYRHLNSPDTLLGYTRSALQGNPDLIGCSISFEPYFFKGRKYFSAYSSNTDGEVETIQEGSDAYQYFYMDWYLLPKLLNQPCWTEPYSDWESDDDYSKPTEMLISYCKPLTAADGSFIGVISMDLSPKWLSEQLASIKPYPNSYCILVSRGGTFLVHPDPDKLFYQTIFTRSLVESNPSVENLGHDMQAWKEGMQEVEMDGVVNHVFFKPLKSTGWSLAIVCPEEDIFGGFDRLRTLAVIMVLLGLLAMYFASTKVVEKTVKPLRELTAEAESIAEGDFGHHLMQAEREDEIGALSRSFDHMQTSLVSYIEELKETTAKKERIEGDLRIAHDIQMAMVPQVFPAFPEREELDLYALMTPAREVGGDLYDYFLIGDKLYFCVGDVSGKGIPASLFMATTRNLFRVVGKEGVPPSTIACRLNDTLSDENAQNMFVTAFIGVLDLLSGKLEYCNCGHNPPVLFKSPSAAPAFLEDKPNTPLGAVPEWEYKGNVISDFHGKALFVYTDGLTEAENAGHEEFGDDRMMKELGSKAFVDAGTTVKRMQKAVGQHVHDAPASDDLTMLCIRLKA